MKTSKNATGLLKARQIALEIVGNEEYQNRLLLRAKAGELPPALETMIWHYAYGKPLEKIALTEDTTDLSELSNAELSNLIKDLQEVLVEPEDSLDKAFSGPQSEAPGIH